MSRRSRCLLLAIVGCAAVGCGERGTRFESDTLTATVAGLTTEQSASIDAVLTEFFGTPDEPRLPDRVPQLAQLVDLDALHQAAGPVISHEPGVTQGLYRRHCARCHGVTGNGRGPTARYQAPYPRDFRRGIFKWKSTYRESPPTVADLRAVLNRGVPGTAMPSFALLSGKERDLLRQYVQYLAIRGQTERALIDFVADEFADSETLILDDDLRQEIARDVIAPIVTAWIDADAKSVWPDIDSTSPVLTTDERVAAGRELYHGERAGCYKCHGPEGQGGATPEVDYDVWTRAQVIDEPNERIASLLARDLPARPSLPRELVGSTPHGGTDPLDVFRRLHQGVAGTPMPAVGGTRPGELGALTDEEVGYLTDYVLTLMAIPSPPAEGVASR
ncbi:MAG: c-type cytochrome [Planctomycetota bacterium]